MTIRRDVDRLAKQGRVFKVLGGVQNATAPKQFYESTWHQRISRNANEKQAIALEALRQIEPDRTVFLDGGTTSLALAKAMVAGNRQLNVVTNSTFVCLELAKGPQVNILSLGGKFDASSGCFVGPTSEELAARFFVDIAFFSTLGVLPSEGTFESNIATLRIKQIIAEQAGKIVLLADHTKFGARALCKVLDIHQIHQIVTDARAPESIVSELEQNGPQVTVAARKSQAAEVRTRAT
jgi:DeoR/GlpR family transcriptional regulator of sugar metabolism